MKILLSPAKSISLDQNYPAVNVSKAHFLTESENLVGKLKKYSSKKLKALYSVSSDIAQLNHDRFQHWQSPLLANEQVKPCVFAFNGEVYRGLDALSLDPEALDYLNSNTRILSGLYGILKPLDLIYPYRLEMGTSFSVTPKVKNLYQFWGNKLTDYLNNEESESIINLASIEYFKAINTKLLKAKLINIQFKEFKNGEYKMLMTYAKHARGEMAKFAAHKKINLAEELKSFDYLGYQYMENMSSENEWVFVR